MYIFELGIKIFYKIKNRDFKFLAKKPPEDLTQEEEKCEHVFVPIDSQKRVLACSKCGFMVKVDPDKIKPQNPFS